MSSTLIEVTEGWTSELGPFVLKVNGQALDLTGLVVSVILRDANRNPKTFDGTVRVDSDQVNKKGYVYFTPTASTFVAGQYPYRIHFEIVDSPDVVFVPNGQAYDLPVWPK